MSYLSSASNESLDLLWNVLFNLPVSGVGNWVLGLFQNNVNTSPQTVWADLVESTFGGYSRVPMDRALWTVGVVDPFTGVPGTWGTSPTFWMPTTTGGGQWVYGFFILNLTTGKLVFSGNSTLPGPVVIGSKIGLIPTVVLQSL